VTKAGSFRPLAAPRAGRALWLSLAVIALISLALSFTGEQGRLWLRFDRGGLAAGELWRLVTGHLVHLSTVHAIWNLAALALLGALLGDCCRLAQWARIVVAAMLAIDAGLFWLSPGVEWYVGLSGVLHGIALAGAVLLAVQGSRVGLVLALGVVGKVVAEQWLGPLDVTASSIGGSVIVDAHLYGAVGGAAAAAAELAAPRVFDRPL
jgi:rhomboid family GlyGly-CTERM serine protease